MRLSQLTFTHLDRSFTRKSAWQSSISSRLWEVINPSVLHPALRPLRTPAGASSMTKPALKCYEDSIFAKRSQTHNFEVLHRIALRQEDTGRAWLSSEYVGSEGTRHVTRPNDGHGFALSHVFGGNKDLRGWDTCDFQCSGGVFTRSRSANSPSMVLRFTVGESLVPGEKLQPVCELFVWHSPPWWRKHREGEWFRPVHFYATSEWSLVRNGRLHPISDWSINGAAQKKRKILINADLKVPRVFNSAMFTKIFNCPYSMGI